jgi:inner membrane protein
MDNLTHSLAGAILGQMGLKQKTALAMPTLIIAANIPDIDAVATLLGGHQHLAIRRGITHGPPAMIILPLLLTGAMLAWDEWKRKGDQGRAPVNKGWLLALAFIGTLSHPAMDWLNSYGIRLLEPFSSQWFYGDTIFIIDIWIWAALIASVWFSLRREKRGHANWKRPAWVGFAAVCAYIFANGLITSKAEAEGRYALEKPAPVKTASTEGAVAETGTNPRIHDSNLLVVANPVPFKFWEREMLWRLGTEWGKAEFSLFRKQTMYRHLKLCFVEPCPQPAPHQTGFQNPKVKEAFSAGASNPDFAAYIFWSRMPIVKQDGTNLIVSDQRFDNPLVGDRFSVRIPAR